ncbi:MAG TPA: cupredoxin domain-containing protein [Actinomycetota bacterium]|nr:cupredoxin domain-containing protein [Actinomycetota bacterium]
MKRSVIASVALIVALSVAAPATGASRPGDHTSGAVTRVRVRIVDFRFRPASITIERGTVVTWVNRGNTTHTSTSASWDSGRLSPGDSFKKRFRRRGTFSYHCAIHSNMMGRITVT